MFLKDVMEGRKKYKFLLGVLLSSLTILLSFLLIHYLLTHFFNFSTLHSISILIPVFLISFPYCMYEYYVGFRNFYCDKATMEFNIIRRNKKEYFIKLLKILFYAIVILILALIGLHYIINDRSFYIGDVHAERA